VRENLKHQATLHGGDAHQGLKTVNLAKSRSDFERGTSAAPIRRWMKSKRQRNRASWCWIVLLLAVHATLLARSAQLQSPTLNEPGHLVAGIFHWETGDFSLYRVNPPLIRLIAAIPSVLLGYEQDWSGYYEHVGARPVFAIAEDYIRANKRDSLLGFWLGRCLLLPFSILGASVCYGWANELFGKPAGLMAATLWCFSPMVLGHASLLTPDAHATSLGLAACFTFWRWLKRPSWKQAVVTGMVLGFAELSKTTMIIFYPLWPLLWIAYRWPDRRKMSFRDWRREAGMLLLRMCVGLYVLNIGYLCDGSLTKLDEYRFVSELMTGDENVGGNRFDDSWLGDLPIPLPADYVIGIDLQQRDFEDFGMPSYLRGRFQDKGWWYYYLYAVLVKTPAGTLGLVLLATICSLCKRSPRITRRDRFVLLTPPFVIFVIASSKFGFSHHSRYVLPCLPFVVVSVSGLAGHLRTLAETALAIRRRRVAIQAIHTGRWVSSAIGILAIGLLSWTTASSLLIYPHSISYFNEFAGGPKKGPSHLLNSNIDWGQDLLFLERWMQGNPGSVNAPVYLAFYSDYNPFDLQIGDVQPWPFRQDSLVTSSIPEGRYAISVNLLYEYPKRVRDREGSQYRIDNRPLTHLRRQIPIGRAGFSIRVFSAQQVRDAYAASEASMIRPR